MDFIDYVKQALSFLVVAAAAVGAIIAYTREKFSDVAILIKASQGEANLKVQQDLTKMDKRLTGEIATNRQDIAIINEHLKIEDQAEPG